MKYYLRLTTIIIELYFGISNPEIRNQISVDDFVLQDPDSFSRTAYG